MTLLQICRGLDELILSDFAPRLFNDRKTTLSVSCPALSIPPTPIHFASATPHTLKGGIDALAISPDGKRFVVGGKDGLMRVGELGSANGKVTSLKGHVADITAVKFVSDSAL